MSLHAYSQAELENSTKRYHIDTFVHLKDGTSSNSIPLLNPKYLVTPYHLENKQRVIVLRTTEAQPVRVDCEPACSNAASRRKAKEFLIRQWLVDVQRT